MTEKISKASEKIDPKLVNVLWATPEQADELAPMHARLFDKAWDEATFSELLNNPSATAFIAQIAGPKRVTVGFIIGRFAADEAEILTVGVAPEIQQRGIGRILVEALGRAARLAEINRMFLEVAASNDAAIGLYRALEFKDVGKRDNYYGGNGTEREDALVLARELH